MKAAMSVMRGVVMISSYSLDDQLERPREFVGGVEVVELGLVLEQGDVAIFPDAGVAEADHLLAQQEFGRLPAILLDGAIGLVQIVPVTQLFQPLPNRDVFGMREGQRQDDLRIHRERWQ